MRQKGMKDMRKIMERKRDERRWKEKGGQKKVNDTEERG